MAVEIPVVVDVDKAFKDAASRVTQTIKPLQAAMDANALQIRLQIGDGKQLMVSEILESATLSSKQLKSALDDIDMKIRTMSKSGGFDLSKDLKYSEKLMLQAAGALESKINGVKDGSAIMARVFAINIDRTKAKISELTATMDVLQRKQNESLKIVNGQLIPKGTGKTYQRTQEQIRDVNERLNESRIYLGRLTTELEKVSGAGKQAALSVAAIKTPAMQMAEMWRRGSMYVERYNASLTTANSKLLMLVKSSGYLLALHAATSFIRNIRNVTAEFEMQRVALGGIIQDTERAQELFSQIKAAALQSPFEIKDLVRFTKQLSAYRIETDRLFEVTMRLADISAGLGVDMNRLVLAYGQVRAASVLRGQELRQFTEAGIPLVELLAEKFSDLNKRMVSTGEVFELISRRAVPFRMIEEIFEDMTNAGGIFYKMQEKQSETLKGQLMKLRDAFSIMYDEIGNTKAVHGAMVGLLKDAMQLLQNWRELGKDIGIVITSLIAYKIAMANARVAANALTAAEMAEVSALELNVVGRSRLVAAIFGENTATKLSIALGNAYVAVKKREMMATNIFTRSLYKMTAALLANPYAIAIAAAAGLIAILVKLSKASKEAAISTEMFQKSLSSYKKSEERARDIDNLCSSYDELITKTSRTKDEEEKLSRITKELAKAYPAAVTGVDDQTKALKINTDAIRANNDAVRDAIRLSFLKDKKSAQDVVDALQNEYSSISKTLERGTITKSAYRGTAGFFQWEEALSEKQREAYGRRLIEITEELKKYNVTLAETDKILEGLDDERLGPPLPDFFGNAWKMNLNKYTYLFEDTLKHTQEKTAAFQKDEIERFTTLEEAIEAAVKRYEDLDKSVEFYTNALESASGAEAEQIRSLLTNAKAERNVFAQILTDYNAWGLLKSSTKTAYQKDAFITLMENRIKFMKDFKKGYDDLSKYLTSQGALDKQSGIMLGRGLSLEMSASEQRRAAEDLSNWYQDQIDAVTAEMKRKGAKGTTITDILGQQFKGESNWAKLMRDYQQLLQSLWDAKTDFDTSQAERNMENALKKIEDEIKRSETARNFYNNILDLTGDKDIAANMTVSVYGGIGQDFKGRMQEQLTRALTDLQPGDIDEDLFTELMGDITLFDTDAIKEKMAGLPPEVQKVFQQVLDANEKYNAEWLIDFEKTFAKAKTYTERTEQLQKQSEQKQREAKAMGKSPEEIAAVQAYYNQKIANVQLEALKDTYTWTKAFEDLGGVSNATLGNLINLIDEYIKKYGKDLEPQQLKELTRAKENAKAQLMSRDAYASAADSVDTLLDASARLWYYQEMGLTETEEYIKALDEQQRALLDLERAMQDIQSQTEKVISSAKKMMNVFASDEDSAYFSEQMDNISSAIFSTISAGTSLAKLLTGTGGPQDVINLVTAIADIVSSIFAADKAAKMREIEKEMKSQERLLADLEESYGRLEKAIAKSFGSDYIYNYGKQLENLRAQQAAYEKQAELERQKGKKADIEKINDYERSARDVAAQIAEMQHQLSEYFTGTDLTSAAKDFANSWIEAYKQFGSTSEAMKEKFQEMVQSMVEQSLGAKIMQEILDPLFQEIDRMADTGGELSAGEIAQIGSMAPEFIEKINLAMENLMAQLSAAGYNIRQAPGQFTGIARDIAGASEESINGLAAGINTQNFYMQHIDMNVAAILATLTGGSTTAGASTTGEYVDPYKDQMLLYVGSLPQMRDDMASIRTMLERVIKPNGTPATHYVSSRVS